MKSLRCGINSVCRMHFLVNRARVIQNCSLTTTANSSTSNDRSDIHSSPNGSKQIRGDVIWRKRPSAHHHESSFRNIPAEEFHIVLFGLAKRKKTVRIDTITADTITQKMKDMALFSSDKELSMLLYGLSALKFNRNDPGVRDVLFGVRDVLLKHANVPWKWNRRTVSMALYGLKNAHADTWGVKELLWEYC